MNEADDNIRGPKPASSAREREFGKENSSKSNAIEIPKIALSKGGGALKGIDEKFPVNVANGTAGYSIPLPLNPGRNGFTFALSLSYNFGAGNCAFGLGWDIGLPARQRITDKKRPRSRDATDEDIFLFSCTEDLVSFLYEENDWQNQELPKTDGTVKRYRPRIERGFSIIEMISLKLHGVYSKVTSKENMATIFGRSPERG